MLTCVVALSCRGFGHSGQPRADRHLKRALPMRGLLEQRSHPLHSKAWQTTRSLDCRAACGPGMYPPRIAWGPHSRRACLDQLALRRGTHIPSVTSGGPAGIANSGAKDRMPASRPRQLRRNCEISRWPPLRRPPRAPTSSADSHRRRKRDRKPRLGCGLYVLC
jgi:hypothetical protein